MDVLYTHMANRACSDVNYSNHFLLYKYSGNLKKKKKNFTMNGLIHLCGNLPPKEFK